MNDSTGPHFIEALKDLLGVEGDFSNHPDDPGGATRYGITRTVARQNDYYGPMSQFPIDLARDIYRRDYWYAAGCDYLVKWYPPLAGEVFEASVNLGVVRVVRYLQMGLNALNRQERDWQNITVDGAFGPKTTNTVNLCQRERGKDGLDVLRKVVNGCQLYHYLTLAQDDSKFESFFFGWVLQRI